MPALLRAMAARQLEHVLDLYPDPVLEGCLEDRVTSFLKGLAPALERSAPVRFSALSMPVSVDAVTAAIDLARQSAHQRLAATLAPDGIDLDCEQQLAAALEVTTDPMTWRLMRIQQRLSIDDACAQMTTTALALLTAHR